MRATKYLIALFAITGTVFGAVGPWQPFLSQNCLKCHGPEKQKGDFRVDKQEWPIASKASAVSAAESAAPIEMHGPPTEGTVVGGIKSVVVAAQVFQIRGTKPGSKAWGDINEYQLRLLPTTVITLNGDPTTFATIQQDQKATVTWQRAEKFEGGETYDIYSAKTLAAWVRLDRLGAPYQSLLHTDGWNKSNPGQVHWMATKLATMRLALFANTLAPGSDETNGHPDSRTSVLPEHGRWVHFATVYDSAGKTVRFYLNGLFDKETHQAIAHPARLGPAQIGNWDRQDRKLSGRVDELLLLGRAMSDGEVRALFEAGNPYR